LTRQQWAMPSVKLSESDYCELTVWRDPPASGPLNMAADEALARVAEQSDKPLMRLYSWHPHTISLGGFQAFSETEGLAELVGWPIVRRPSGGGAIVHGSDLTYCVALPAMHPWARRPEDLYAAVHGALVEELCHRGVAAAMVDAELAARVPDDSFLCFNRRAFGDVVIAAAVAEAVAGGCKVLGSAQRRLAGVVLQHGSLLLRRHPLMARTGSHAGLSELANVEGGDPSEVVEGWLRRLATRFGGPLTEMANVSWLADDPDILRQATRYSSDDWLRRR
jgi:lipoate-protein ligase A